MQMASLLQTLVSTVTNGVHYGGTPPLPFEWGGNGGTGALHTSSISKIL